MLGESPTHFLEVGQVQLEHFVPTGMAAHDLHLARPQTKRLGEHSLDRGVRSPIDGRRTHPHAHDVVDELHSVGARIRMSFDIQAQRASVFHPG